MSIVDIIIIALILVAAIFGFFKGFFKSLVSLLGFIVSLALAVLLAKVVANALLEIDAIGKLVAGKEGSLFSWLQGILPKGLEGISTEDLATAPDIDALIAAETLQTSWFMKLFYPIVGSGLKNPAYLAAMSNARQIMAMELAYSIYVLIVGIALFLVIRIIAAIFSILFRKFMDRKKTLGSRLGGSVLGAVKGFMYCMIILLVISMVSNFSFVQPVSNEVNKGKISSAMAEMSLKVTSLIGGEESEKHHVRLLELGGFLDIEGLPEATD